MSSLKPEGDAEAGRPSYSIQPFLKLGHDDARAIVCVVGLQVTRYGRDVNFRFSRDCVPLKVEFASARAGKLPSECIDEIWKAQLLLSRSR